VYLYDSDQLDLRFLFSIWGARRCCGAVPNPKSLNLATWSIRETRFRHVYTFGLREDVVGCALSNVDTIYNNDSHGIAKTVSETLESVSWQANQLFLSPRSPLHVSPTVKTLAWPCDYNYQPREVK